jgi:hypothetical protein
VVEMGDPRGWVDRLVGMAFGLLIAAVACVVAVNLLQEVWVGLVVIGGVAIGLWVGASLIGTRRRGW